jgi:hypothetical protein
MDGAGIMNLPTQVGGSNTQDGLDSFAPLIAAQQTARDMGYPRFTRELLAAGSEMDPAEVQEFLQTIRDAGLTPDDVALMRRVVEAVFNDPNNYPEVRESLLREGVPEDLLPETFDLEFFTALRMAVEEAENLSREPRPTEQEMPMGMPMEGAPVEMAEGGIVGLPELKPIARAMASMGRQGDTMLAHITPQEAMMLKRMGGSGSINPYTGLPEFFIGKALKSLGRGISRGLKGIAKGIKKFAKSTVGRIVIGVALGAFLGPMAAGLMGGLGPAATFALSSGIGTFGSSLLAGDGFKNSLRNGLTAGALSYAGAGVFGEAGFSNVPAAGSPTTFAQGLEQGIANVKAPFQAAADFVRGGPEAAANVPTPGVGPVSTATEQLALGDVPGATFGRAPLPAAETINIPQNLGQGLPGGPGYTPPLPPASSINVPSNLGQGLPGGPGYQGGNILDRVTQGASDLTQGAKDIYSEYLSPSRAGIQGRSADTIFDELVTKGLPKTADTLKLATDMAAKEAPGFLTKYGPLTAAAGTTLAATGALNSFFTPPQQEEGESYEAYMARRKVAEDKFRQDNPQFFGSFLPQSFAEGSGPNGVENPALEKIKSSALLSRLFSRPSADEEDNAGLSSLMKRLKGSGLPISSEEDVPIGPTALFSPGFTESLRRIASRSGGGQTFDIERLRQERPELFGTFTPRTYAEGTGPQGVEDFPRKNGHISGPGTGTSDDIPAMLSDGEFVFTARAVRNMGGGSRRKGAAKMYRLMKMLEGGPVGKTAKA